MTDYWLNKLIFELQGPDGREQWTNRREEVIAKYDLSLDIRTALIENDIGTLLPHVNPYLMRFFLLMLGYDDDQSISVLAEFQTEEDRKRLNG
ncbi:MAG: hypothetical protein VX700_11730 [Pseudomonadota bacterium]|nr:hypothetical protein [Pseudomonadota bacterium]